MEDKLRSIWRFNSTKKIKIREIKPNQLKEIRVGFKIKDGDITAFYLERKLHNEE